MASRLGKVPKMLRKQRSKINLHGVSSSQNGGQLPHSDSDERLLDTMSGLRLNETKTQSTVILNPNATISSSDEISSSLGAMEETNATRHASPEYSKRKKPIYCFLERVKEGTDILTNEDTCNDPSSNSESILSTTNFRGEDCLSPESNGSLSTSSLLSPLNSKQKLNANLSASSLDSGVGSARNSKRSSIEQTNMDPASSDFMLSSLRKTRSRCQSYTDVGDLLSPNKENSPIIREDSIPTIIEDKAPKTRRNRLSVDEVAFSQLLRAATDVVMGAQPLSSSTGLIEALRNEQFLQNSLQDYKRRKSEWDLPMLKPRQQYARKNSAESILQRTPSSGGQSLGIQGHKPLRSNSSACIICERKRKVTQNFESSVLIKTSMAKTMQEGRRFSEVLRVYKPGELPFTEFVVPKICDLKTPTALAEPLAAEKSTTLVELVDENMPLFVRLTNWSCLYAYLVSKKLLDPHMREYMIGTATQHEKGNKFYGEYLPSHGELGYQRLLECLKEEEEHPGHEQLAKKLESGLKRL